MTDVVAEVKDVVAEKEVEKTTKDDVVVEEGDVEKNGDAKDKEETESVNGSIAVDKVEGETENGSGKENGVSEENVEDPKPEGEVCGVKRKSEVGIEPSEDAAIETSECKKQKVEETAEPEVASNGVC